MSLGPILIVIGLLAIGGLTLWLLWPDRRRRDELDP